MLCGNNRRRQRGTAGCSKKYCSVSPQTITHAVINQAGSCSVYSCGVPGGYSQHLHSGTAATVTECRQLTGCRKRRPDGPDVYTKYTAVDIRSVEVTGYR